MASTSVPTAVSPLFSISMSPTMSASIFAIAETIFDSWRSNSSASFAPREFSVVK